MTVDVSVVIPARDAAATLPATLRALAAQRFAGTSEVLVVDDRSTDATVELAAASGRGSCTSTTGPGPARNAGAAAATGAVLAFTDADCEPDPGWLAAGSRRSPAAPSLVQGRSCPRARSARTTGRSGSRGPRRCSSRRTSSSRARRSRARAAFRRSPPAAAGRREVVRRGHAVRLGRAPRRRRGGLRARRGRAPRGLRALGSRVRRRARRLRFFPALVREVPELRGHLPRGVFLTRRSAAFDVAVAGVAAALAGRRPGPAVLAAPYLVMARPGWPPARWRVKRFAAGVAADAVGLASLVQGSVAARSPVL
jgi:glycosyltransferase involved in cell wall biosynthesis